jgi:hypothetical protein
MSARSFSAAFTVDATPGQVYDAELVPGQRVVWHVVEAELNFVDDKDEWTGTDIIFDITRKADGTELRFTHAGLLTSAECFNDCSSAWSHYINGALRKLILERTS